MARQKRCSYCYQRGHTRPTCPELKKHIADNPDGYYARVEQRKVERKARRGPSLRKCSYCKMPGHNKATCTELVHDRDRLTRENKKFAKAFVEGCKEFGLYPGALIELRKEEDLGANRTHLLSSLEWLRKQYGNLGMVTGFYEPNLNSHLSDQDRYIPSSKQNCIWVRFPNGRKSLVSLPREFRHLAHNSEECKEGYWQIACGVEAGKILNLFTEKWKSGKLSVDTQLGLDR